MDSECCCNIILTIIVPMYNAENRIPGTIHMLRSMEDERLEFILVDDGSSDKTLKIVSELTVGDRRFRVIPVSHAGAAQARNAGIDAAGGQYIMFLDDDDELNTELISGLLPELSTDVDLYLFAMEMRWASGYSEVHSLCREAGNSGSGEKLRHLMLTGYEANSACGRIFKRSIIQNNHILFPASVSRGEDQIFMIRYAKYVNSYLCSDRVIYYYDRRSGSSMGTYRENWLDDQKAVYLEKCTIGTPQEASRLTMSVFFEIVFKAVLYGEEKALLDRLNSNDGEFWKQTAKAEPLFADRRVPMLLLAKAGNWKGLCGMCRACIPVWKLVNRKRK